MPVGITKSTSWWRLECWDHPGWTDKQPASFGDPRAKASGAKPKVFCKACWKARLDSEMVKDGEELQRGERHEVRAQVAIKDWLWSFAFDDNPPWLQGRTETILRHLAVCPHTTDFIRNKAREEKLAKGLMKSPIKSRPEISLNTPHLYFQSLTPYASSSTSQLPQLGQPAILGSVHPPGPSAIPQLPLGALFQGSSPVTSLGSTPTGNTPSPLHLFGNLGFDSPQISPAGSPMLSAMGAVMPSTKRRRTGLSTPSQAVIQWSSAHQVRFESRLARITASCGFPLRWVENIEWFDFCTEFIPLANSVSRRILTDRLIPAEVEVYRSRARQSCQDQDGTLQCDGWSGVNFHHFLAFMLTTSKREVHTVRVFDTSQERKTADKLLEKINEIKFHVESEWRITLVAITSDASGESAKARRLVRQLYPQLLTPDCYGHQINLIASDYLHPSHMHSLALLETAESATVLITWLRSKTFILALIRANNIFLLSRQLSIGQLQSSCSK